MNGLFGIALGGAVGSMLRFLVASGVSQWLGRGFPYGTFAVNTIGAFLIGFLSEVLILQKVTMSAEYRLAILVGGLGGLTTFSTFSLETVQLLQQGQVFKAGLNVLASVGVCLLATWFGLITGKSLFVYAGGILHWQNGLFPFGLLSANALIALFIGLICAILFHKIALPLEHRALILLLLSGLWITLCGVYLVLYLIEHGQAFDSHLSGIIGVFLANSLFCGLSIWAGLSLAKQF